MANIDHLNLLQRDVEEWNQWREQHPEIIPDLSGMSLHEPDFLGADLHGANLSGANCFEAKFGPANLAGADLSDSVFVRADFNRANFTGANLSRAKLIMANFGMADLTRANLTQADLTGAILHTTKLIDADLREAKLFSANLTEANLQGADLTGCSVYGISVWNVDLTRTNQEQLVVTRPDEPQIRVDNLEMAQFIYLMLNNTKIRDVINTITSKGVLILGRFSDPKRKSVLDGLREKLREYDLLPIVFDFDCPTDKDYTETIQTLAGMSMFVIADLTNPKSTPLELEATVKQFKIPYLPIIDISVDPHPFAMLVDLQKSFHWVLPTLGYETKEDLLDDENLRINIIDRANAKREELRKAKSRQPEPFLIAKKKVTTSPS
ncbi:MAG TPA: pentapeptide repeat-containing protein [Pyrinomonadaceae bacterium]|jgi:hypothetical protein|nr:pentapeptide repeat-containing protein [Pyrinomonadaceae bacterium]